MNWKEFFAILVLLGSCFLAADFYQTGKGALPKDVRTLEEFFQRMPTPRSIRTCAKDGIVYTVVDGPIPGFPSMASGGPRYVFDDSGALVDWAIDVGDNERFNERWKPCVPV